MDEGEEALSILNFLEDVPFILPQLEDVSKQIRLLEILPDLGTKNEICCTMHIRQLDDPELLYTAISYTWGEPKPKKYIYIDGRPLQVGPNCWHALWQVKNNARPAGTLQRERKLDHVYWVDAICINQEDIEEKNVQVAAMGKIYTNAVSVAACIGYESHDSPLFDEQFAWRWHSLAPSQKRHQKGTIFELIEHLLRRPWFHRVWTVQECIMAKDIQVFCGSRCVRWRMLSSQVKMTQNSHTRPRAIRELDDFFRDIDASQMQRDRVAFSVSSVIRRYSMRGCAVPHDRVYGLFSIAQEHIQKRMMVNYERTLFNLLWTYAEAISDHRIVGNHVEIRPDNPTNTRAQYSSISLLAEYFVAEELFQENIAAFWRWRVWMTDPRPHNLDPQTWLESSSSVYRMKVTPTHCHRIDFNVDKISSVSSQDRIKWDEYSKSVKGWREWENEGRAISTKRSTVAAKQSYDAAQSRLLIVDCSDKPTEYPGEMHFQLPHDAKDGDFLVPMQYPAHRGCFHLVCRPVGSSQMPSKAIIVGLAVCIREPNDSRAYMPWLRDKHTAEVFLRPHDLITIALLEDNGIQHFDLPRLEKVEMASHVVLRHATKEERGY